MFAQRTRSAPVDPALRALQEDWAPGWKVWRARRSTDPPGVFEGIYVASRIDEAAGPDRTVIRDSAAELETALSQQRALAARGTMPLRVGYPL